MKTIPKPLREQGNYEPLLPRIKKKVRSQFQCQMSTVSRLTCELIVTSPVSPSSSSSFSQIDSEPDELNVLAIEDGDTDSVKTPNKKRPKHDRKSAGETQKQTQTLRRRPFLIFDKTQPKGYKKLKHNPLLKNTTPTSKYEPGDGFSGREAKPNWLNFLTRNGKQSVADPGIGILDLTQSTPPGKRKRTLHKANLDDNSFVSAPSKKPRCRTKTKDACHPADPSETVPQRVKKSDSAAAAENNTQTTQSAVHEVTDNAKLNHNQQPTATGQVAPQNILAEESCPKKDPEAEMDIAVIERGDDVHESSRNPLRDRSIAAEKPDGCGTHVSDTPLRRPRAISVSSVTSLRHIDRGVGWTVSQRAFRRSNTQ